MVFNRLIQPEDMDEGSMGGACRGQICGGAESGSDSPSSMMAAAAMSDVSIRKKRIRTEVRSRLEALDAVQAHALSVRACARFLETEFFQSALTVMVYLPTPGEVDVAPIAIRCFQERKTLCAPRIDWDHRRMTPVEIRGFDDRFEVRRHGVREPVDGRPVPLEEIDLIIVPGLAFDASGARLGRGSGFYDRFLSQPALRRTATRCGVCFDFQVVDEIPLDPHDVHLDAIVTDRRTIRIGCPRPA